MPNEIRASLLVATKNRASFVERALPMWAAIKGPLDEVIVVDGGSTDRTLDVLAGAPGGLVDVLIHEADLGEAHAFNKGIMRAGGRYIKLITDDDVFFREGLERAYSILDDHPEIDFLVTGGEYVRLANDDVATVPHGYFCPDSIEEIRVARTGRRPWICGAGFIIRRSSIPIVGLMHPRHLWADLSLLMQAEVRGANIRFLRTLTFRHQLHSHSVGLTVARRTVHQVYADLNCRLPCEFTRWRYVHPRYAFRAWVQRLFPGRRPLARPAPAHWDDRLV